MRKVLIFSLLGLLILPFCSFAQGQKEQFIPLVISQEGSGSALFSETRWPDFYEYIPAGGCAALSNYSKKRKPQQDVYPTVPGLQPDQNGDGLFDYINDVDASGNPVFEYEPQQGDYSSIPDLSKSISFSGDLADYRDTAKVVVTWTIRLVGNKLPIGVNYQHDPWFGQACDGTSRQSFLKGNAYTRLFVNGEPIGNPAIMTIPYGGIGQSSGVVDPTHTGAVILTPDMFANGQFPETLNLVVKIYNDTSMVLESPAGVAIGDKTVAMRNLIVTITPIN